MADILYTNTGYVASGYVQATFVGAASVSSSATLSATGGRIRGASASLFANLSGLTWAEMGTWGEPKQAQWGDNFVAQGDKATGGTVNISSSSTISATGIATLQGAVSITGALNTSINADAILAGLITSPPSTFTLTASATAGILGQGAFTSSFTLSPIGGLLTIGEGTISSNFSVSATGTKVHRVANFNLDAVATAQATGRRIRLAQAGLTSSFNLVANTDLIGEGISLQASSFTFSAVPSRNRLGAGTFTTAFTMPNVPGGFLAFGTANLTTSGAVLVVGSKVAFDPFRRVTVRPESRINIVDQETRILVVPSESRKLTVQHTVLVDEVGPIDRRTG